MTTAEYLYNVVPVINGQKSEKKSSISSKKAVLNGYVQHLHAHQIISLSPNHYSLLNAHNNQDFDYPRPVAKSKHKQPVSGPALKKKIKKPAFKSEDEKLLEELPYFACEDFEGPDHCRRCCKRVLHHHRAILCDKCDYWIHLQAVT